MANQTKAGGVLSKEQADIMSGEFDVYSGFFKRFAKEHFPHLNLIMVDKQDPLLEQKVRDGVKEVFERPETQRGLGSLTYTEALPLFNEYTDILVSRTKSPPTDTALKKPEKNVKDGVGFYETYTPRSEIFNAGGQVSLIVINNGSCSSCKPSMNLHNCNSSRDTTDAYQQLERIQTGFHELAHAIHMRGVSYPGAMFSAMVSNKNMQNRFESVADSFTALMMVREFGALGVDYVRLWDRSAGHDADHTTFRAQAATREWMSENEEKLFSLTPAQLFEVAQQIGEKHALTPAEHRQTENYQAHYAGPSHFTLDAINNRLGGYEQHMAGNGAMPPAYGPMGQEIDRAFLDFSSTYQASLMDMRYRLITMPRCDAPLVPPSLLSSPPAQSAAPPARTTKHTNSTSASQRSSTPRP